MNGPDYIVVRPARDLPPGFLPPHMDGRWFDRTMLPESGALHGPGDAVAVATGRFEVRDDGAVAEVFEMRP